MNVVQYGFLIDYTSQSAFRLAFVLNNGIIFHLKLSDVRLSVKVNLV